MEGPQARLQVFTEDCLVWWLVPCPKRNSGVITGATDYSSQISSSAVAVNNTGQPSHMMAGLQDPGVPFHGDGHSPAKDLRRAEPAGSRATAQAQPRPLLGHPDSN